MHLDVIVPTYNRHELLKLTLQSLLVAEIPSGLTVGVTVVDNNSTDQTLQTVESFKESFLGRLNYVFARKQGRSPALNAGIAVSCGELVGMIDDDEEIDRGWYINVHEAFTKNELDFIGGPYHPRWPKEPPSWLSKAASPVIGIIDGGPLPHPFGGTDDELMGGNAVLTRSILDRVGPYAEDLGRQGDRALADEDTDMYQRLLAIGARGMYLPDLVIYHYIHPERLTKRYFRKWHFWRGTSSGLLDKKRPKEVAYLLGIPRYLFGSAARASFRILRRTMTAQGDAKTNFADELQLWDLAGFFYGRHFYQPLNK